MAHFLGRGLRSYLGLVNGGPQPARGDPLLAGVLTCAGSQESFITLNQIAR